MKLNDPFMSDGREVMKDESKEWTCNKIKYDKCSCGCVVDGWNSKQIANGEEAKQIK
jgi:hypothetical protein